MFRTTIYNLNPAGAANPEYGGNSNNMLRDCQDGYHHGYAPSLQSSHPRKFGVVKPIDISSPPRRGMDEDTVADLANALTRDGRFLDPIVVRAEGASQYRLIAGDQRLEAWKRHFCEQPPIPAIIYPSDTPQALITVLEIEENLLRKELRAAEQTAQTIRLVAALKKLNGGKSVAPASESGDAAESGEHGSQFSAGERRSRQ